MKWLWYALAIGAGFVVGRYYDTISTLWKNRGAIGAAGEVAGGLSDAWHGLEQLWGSKG